MTTAYVLHYAPDNASLIVRIALSEAGAAFTTRLVDRRRRAQTEPAYRALAPTGRIPVLETPQGPIFETGAILLWLAERHPAAGLGPAPDSPARGDFLKWLFFLSNSLHADLRQLFYPETQVPPGAIAGHHAITSARILQHFALMERACADHPALFAAPSVLTIYLCTLMRWSVLYPAGQTRWFDAADFPTLLDLCRRTEQRAAVRDAALAEGLGDTPFSAPQPACPPEGSAT
ncbi:glutathione S-transferase family protein [Szabonella alba]|uniref:Glutathione S-transferase family protein n=1 Tax=Szabonella alba TaxID=2804194 RepID=A0A8K0XZF0_9RHOB|nr:glutathione S-transferase family protein [Szabonella alba]MBL4915993.1 glutathione S-transferase family protein [Szabonella alba]